MSEPLRKLLRGETGLAPAELEALALLPDALRPWCDSEEEVGSLEELYAVLRGLPAGGGEAQATWLDKHRAELSSLLRRLVAQAR